MQLLLGTSLVTFDGTVVEAFGATANSNGRVHIAALDCVEVKENRKEAYLQFHTIWRTSPVIVMFPKDQRQAAEQFAAQVNQATA